MGRISDGNDTRADLSEYSGKPSGKIVKTRDDDDDGHNHAGF